jgi:thiamine transport system ATP-binding protein
MLHVRDLRVSYGDVVAVRDVGIDLDVGETLALLGRSGSGKTTILRAIAGLVHLDGGTVELDGRDVTTVPTHRRGIGMVFQDFALFPHLDVFDNVAYGLRTTGADDIDRRVRDALVLVGLDGLEGRRIDQLSGGQAQRVALARTIVTEPDLLLLDEPLGSLDRDLRSELAEELHDLLQRTGIPTIVVTHDTEEAFALGDRIAVVVDGTIAVVGTPDEVWASPGTTEAARLVGHRNLVPAVVRDGIASVGETSIPVAAPDGPTTLLLVPGAITPSGDIEATVLAVRYRGPRWVGIVHMGGATVEVPLRDRVEPGASIAISIDATGVIALRR